MSIKKVGGIWFIKLGRVGFNFYVSRKQAQAKPLNQQLTLSF
jgi:hypothetical protein